MENKYTGLEVAVIGISLKFPDSNTPDEFWENLINKKNLVKEFSPQDLKEIGVPEEIYTHNNFVNKGIELDDKMLFDNNFFGYTAKEAKLMDPQTRIYHQCVWAGLEDAGINPLEYKDKIGIFSSAAYNFDRIVKLVSEDADAAGNFMKLQFGLHDTCSTLISNKLNLKGPALNLNTACSSSLTAIHIASRNLLLGECKVAIAGGVKIIEKTNYGYIYQEGMINSKDGYCRPFDNESSGTVAGMGAGVVILKKLQNAIKDGDHIYCVIKGSSVNNDGNRKHSYSSPSEYGQIDCITEALSVARVDPKSIGYIEAHGTGTKIGDPIEIKAILKSYKPRATSETCYIGSVKSNFGHLDSAAGVIGFIKAALCLKKKKIPATLHFKNKNSLVDFDFLKVPTETIDFESTDGSSPLRAAVSSFGIGGTNVHAILEEYKEETVREYPEDKERLFVFSAKNDDSLKENIHKFKTFLDTNHPNLGDVSWTLKHGRAPFSKRAYFISSSHDDLKKQLAAYPAPSKNGNSTNGIQTQGKQWLEGNSVNWDADNKEKNCRKISLPTYSFVKNDFTWNPKRGMVRKHTPVKAEKIHSNGNGITGLSEFETRLLTIFHNFFEDPSIVITDDFFELGGDSLSVVSLNSEITKEFKVNLLSQDIFESKDIRSLAKLVETEVWNLSIDNESEGDTNTIII